MLSAGLIFLAEAFQKDCVFGMIFVVARLAPQGFLQFTAGFT